MTRHTRSRTITDVDECLRLTMTTSTTTPRFLRLSMGLWGLVTAAGGVTGAASILGFFGPFNWLLDLRSHFRLQYALALGVVAILLLIPRKRRTAAVFGALALANRGVILPLYVGKTPTLASDRVPVRAMLMNVNTKLGNPAAVAEAITRFSPDIVALEEVSTKWPSDLQPVLPKHPSSADQLPADRRKEGREQEMLSSSPGG